MTDVTDEPGFALYVHWPFCRAKCPYCDFNSHVVSQVDQARWRRALVHEIRRSAKEVHRPLDSIFFGGGTPSLMPPATVAAVIEAAEESFGFSRSCEITLEANPTSVEAAGLAGFRAAGVNRVSLGVQALDDDALAFLGREHDAEEALVAVTLAHRLFARVSFDLIYARPGQTPEAWREELLRALDHAGGHLSVYQLTIEPGTRFHALHATGALVMPGDDHEAELYALTQEVLEAAGLPAYEISNHARPGEACRHNLVYWRSGDWIGVGPGAHGRLTLGGQRVATEALRAPGAWLQAVEAEGSGERGRDAIDSADRIEEFLMMGLRLAEGVERARFEALAGVPLDQGLDPTALADLQATGLLELDRKRLRVTARGRLMLNAVLRQLLA